MRVAPILIIGLICVLLLGRVAWILLLARIRANHRDLWERFGSPSALSLHPVPGAVSTSRLVWRTSEFPELDLVCRRLVLVVRIAGIVGLIAALVAVGMFVSAPLAGQVRPASEALSEPEEFRDVKKALAALLLTLLLGLVLALRGCVFSRLRTRHPQAWQESGSPSFRSTPWRQLRVEKTGTYLWGSGAKELGDARLHALALGYRAASIALWIVWILVVFR